VKGEKERQGRGVASWTGCASSGTRHGLGGSCAVVVDNVMGDLRQVRAGLAALAQAVPSKAAPSCVSAFVQWPAQIFLLPAHLTSQMDPPDLEARGQSIKSRPFPVQGQGEKGTIQCTRYRHWLVNCDATTECHGSIGIDSQFFFLFSDARWADARETARQSSRAVRRKMCSLRLGTGTRGMVTLTSPWCPSLGCQGGQLRVLRCAVLEGQTPNTDCKHSTLRYTCPLGIHEDCGGLP
jgi:hypothetical protein